GGALYVGLSSPGTPNRPGALTEHGDRGPAIAAVSPSNTVILDTNTEQLKPSPAPGDNEMGGAPALSHSEPGAPQAKLAAPDQPVHKSPPADTDTNTKPSPSASGESLAAEVAALQKAREALAAGRPKKALTELNIYTKRFRGGRLALEAEVLRIEALAQSGERKAAAVLAESFLAAHPSSPYANRVRAIAEPSKAAPIQ
ncbi:MAG: outer membrane protein assembly factor BamD, partial [Polyangiaceae bacterium]|nr:outer membrane protein assembly factor BamD [Polyangiaceae bacterium]